MNPGLILKKRREELDLSVEQAADFTKLKARHIEAIESWQIEELPTGAYLKGFLKNYCTFLSLNIEEVAGDENFEDKDVNPIIPEIVFEESKPKTIYLIVSLSLLVIIYLVWLYNY